MNLDGEIHRGEFYITIQNTVTEKQEIDKVLNVLTSSCVFLETLTSTSLTVLGTLTLIQLDLWKNKVQSILTSHSQLAHLLLFLDPRSGDDDEERDLFLLSFFRSGERDRDLKKGGITLKYVSCT